MVSRRHVLGGLAACLARPGWAAVGSPSYLAAAQDSDGQAWLHGLTEAGRSLFRVALPARGHAAAAHPGLAEAVAFARRPGRFAVVLDCGAGKVKARLSPPPDHSFNGHGVFSASGDILWTSEVADATGQGWLGVWDSRDGYRRLGQVATGGLGPHDVRLCGDDVLVVANGGIHTDPQDRTKLNLATMRPSLVYLSAEGRMLETATLPDVMRLNSIRHLAVTQRGVAIALQWEGDISEAVPLMGLHRRGEAIRLVPAPEADAHAMRGYAGSIAASGSFVAITSSRGGTAMVFDDDGKHHLTVRRDDISGVAPARDAGFVVTDGLGATWALDQQGLRLLSRHDVAWDNHLVRIATPAPTLALR